MENDIAEKYPEHAKLKERWAEHQHIKEFCWFLQANGLLYRRKEVEGGRDTYWALGDVDIAKVISEYFGIDHQEFQKEKREMLKEIRQNHE